MSADGIAATLVTLVGRTRTLTTLGLDAIAWSWLLVTPLSGKREERVTVAADVVVVVSKLKSISPNLLGSAAIGTLAVCAGEQCSSRPTTAGFMDMTQLLSWQN